MDHKEEHRDAQFLEEIESLREEIAAEQSGNDISRQDASASGNGQSDADSGQAQAAEEYTKPAQAQGQKAGDKDDKQDESLRSTLREIRNFTDDEDDVPAPARKMTLASILGGDILTGGWFRRQFFYILMLVAMVVIYISNRYSCQQQLIEQKALNDTLLDRRFKALTRSSQLKERMRRSYIEGALTDTTLQTASTPSYTFKVDQE